MGGKNVDFLLRVHPTFLFMIYSSFYDSFAKICTNLGLALVFCVITLNFIILIVYKNNFKNMIKILEDNLRQSEELLAEDKHVVDLYTAKGVWAAKFWFGVCAFNDSLFYVKAILGTPLTALQGNLTFVHMYELRYPSFIEDKKDEFIMYLVTFGFQVFYIVFTSIMYVGFNPLGPIFILHACGQIELAIRQVKRLFSDEDFDVEATINKLKNTVRHIQHIYSFVDEIEQTHSLLYEMCIKTSTLAISVSCFGVIESYYNGSVSFDYVFSCSMQCYIPCYYGEMLLSKGEDLRDAIYSCGWERHWEPRTRYVILLLLTRTGHPIGIHAVFCTVCLEAFADMNNNAYRIFNVINAAWN